MKDSKRKARKPKNISELNQAIQIDKLKLNRTEGAKKGQPTGL